MKRLTLIRYEQSDQGTFGALYDESKFIMYTGELPWRQNKVGVSCIPLGKYIVEPWNSARFPRTYHIKDVPDRTAILIHTGNLCGNKEKGFISHVLGCIIVGEKRGKLGGQQAVLLSRIAMGKLREIVKREIFELQIIGDFKNEDFYSR